MAPRYDHHWRLEPDLGRRDLAAGFAAAVHDPAWFLARQWQLGEHQGENASSPVRVDHERVDTRLEPAAAVPDADPTAVPAEAIVEAEPDGWWTIGRRLRVGAAVAERAELDLAAVDDAYLLTDPPPPYHRLTGHLDGLAVWRAPDLLGLDPSVFAGLGIPPARPLLWDPAELVYQAEFPLAGGGALRVPRHRGGRMDWFSADATLPLGAAEPAGEPPARHAYPGALHYPGAPANRWWEIEDAAVDIGGYPPDSAHFATTLLIDLIASHSVDWFLFPVDSPVGHVQTLPSATVTDGFGRSYPVAPPDDWWLFRTTGLDTRSLVVWLRALTPIDGPPLEDVLLGLDEYANLLWAVERRVDGHDLTPPARTAEQEAANPTLSVPDRRAEPTAAPGYQYVPGQDAAPHWHPYEIDELPDAAGELRRRFVQRRLTDLARTHPDLLPSPRADVLRVRTPAGEVVHEIEPATVPAIGVVLQRRHRLARDVDGNPVLWVQRQRAPLLRPPSRAVRFDVLAADSS